MAALQQALQEAKELCEKQGVSVEKIIESEGFERIKLLDEAVDALVRTDDLKRRFLDHTNYVNRLYKAILPDQQAKEFSREVCPLKVISDKIKQLTPPADISQVMESISDLLDRSVSTEGYVIAERTLIAGETQFIDLSEIDFEALAEKFKAGRKRTINEKLKGSLSQKLLGMARLNRTRIDYMEKFQAMIDAYNAGSLNAEEFFRQLVDFAKNLDKEEKRAIEEQLTEEELAMFDLLTKPSIHLNHKEKQQVKATAKVLLEKLKEEKLVLDWRKRQQSRADVRVTIETILAEGLPRVYTPELFDQKTVAVFQHVCESYFGAGRSIYDVAA